jgi:hypothetical protein
MKSPKGIAGSSSLPRSSGVASAVDDDGPEQQDHAEEDDEVGRVLAWREATDRDAAREDGVGDQVQSEPHRHDRRAEPPQPGEPSCHLRHQPPAELIAGLYR